jgi:predicted enzyme related to lactoylglutathione lyase
MNPVIHFEIHSPNLEKSLKFFRTVMGWELKAWGAPMNTGWQNRTSPAHLASTAG